MSSMSTEARIIHRVKERLYHRLPVFSFEFFPPKNEAGYETLWKSLERLAPMKPDFVSVTYGAGGTTRDKTRDIVKEIQSRFGVSAMAHLTCIGATNDEIRALLKEYAEAGICNILALRGDPPKDQPDWTPVANGPQYAIDLVHLSRDVSEFSIGVAGFPEKHPQAPTMEEDLRFLKAKVDAGAEFVITQLFFDNELYFDYVKAARKMGITVPILPGIMPITSGKQIARFRELAGCYIPADLEAVLTGEDMDDERAREMGLAYCAAQCADLLRRGAPGIHFYTLNQSRACHTIHAALKAMGHWNR